MSRLKPNEFICAHCEGIFRKKRDGWSDEAANIEYEHKFPNSHARGEERVLVCDDCYKAMTATLPPGEFDI